MKSIKGARNLIIVVSFILMIAGLVYAFTPKLLPYHEEMLKTKYEDLPEHIAKGAMLLLRVLSIFMIALGIIIFQVARYAFKPENKWAWTTLVIVFSVVLVPLQIFTIIVGAHSPWLLVAIIVIILLYTMIGSKKFFSN